MMRVRERIKALEGMRMNDYSIGVDPTTLSPRAICEGVSWQFEVIPTLGDDRFRLYRGR